MDKVRIGKYINELRNKEGLSLEELSRYTGVSPKTILKWESGKILPKMHDLALLSFRFDVSINDLLNGDSNHLKDDDMIYYYAIVERKKEKVRIITVSILILILVFIVLFSLIAR